ncbi:cysteine--1-D-myo-inosityl 2-amino-2-deoxy-alpha-D-glucopyranoside ligase [Cellulosimicrobium arenosum]|uniref:L-cysteine:1D-myo-inositol 2-amino-2-deoxy-alpha-D-glucopyranoside ligase n=1 Tax=Cellulosimicrobium arenosum TaxID=2708133 RepID=A0A927G603_9MICO|nr:cysteine--1-D-myo-inosityl 2-amino-2-deoxy-alpha-D-glucopyranoside ligase [Cellulosimicrobium arenosum]
MHSWPAPQIPELPGRGHPVRVHDSTTGEQVVAASATDRASLYVCGITPYDATHIGHAATYVAFDLLVRAWRDAGHEVRYASNVTDVDDPLLERAAATGKDWRQIAVEQTALFAEDMTALGVVPPDVYDGAVEKIPAVVDAVTQLLDAGLAYRVPVEPGAGGEDPGLGDVYADLSGDRAFGSVSGFSRDVMEHLFAQRGGDPGRDGKKDALDPLLWRRERPGEPAWDGGVLGTGRPGWHVECAVIARDGIGLPFDVQGGGADLLFPHHEMSSSHDRMLSDGAAPRVHVHAGLVAFQGEKMSKSLGNLVLVSNLRAAGADPMAIRLALLAHHYRGEWEWTDDDLPTAVRRLETWRDAVSGNGGPDAGSMLDAVRAALADDLDAPAALAAVDAWAAESLRPGRDVSGDVEGAPGVVARSVNALLGVRL